MSLSSRLRAGETVLSAWSSLPEPLTVEILAHSAFDAVTLDMQHGGHDEASVLRSLGLILNAGKPPSCAFPSAVSTWQAVRLISARRRSSLQ